MSLMDHVSCLLSDTCVLCLIPLHPWLPGAVTGIAPANAAPSHRSGAVSGRHPQLQILHPSSRSSAHSSRSQQQTTCVTSCARCVVACLVLMEQRRLHEHIV
jgi:hypothetical protein